MPGKFLPWMIENETKEETEIQTLLNVEKFTSEIHLQDLHSEKYKIRLHNVDSNMNRTLQQTMKMIFVTT